MPADARLALAEDLGQILDIQFAAGQQRQDAQTRRLPGGPQSGQRVGEVDPGGRLWVRQHRHKDMFIRVLHDFQGRTRRSAHFSTELAPRAADMADMRTL